MRGGAATAAGPATAGQHPGATAAVATDGEWWRGGATAGDRAHLSESGWWKILEI